MKKLAMMMILLGVGLFVFGAMGFTMYGYDLRQRLEAATGIAVALAGFFLRKNSK